MSKNSDSLIGFSSIVAIIVGLTIFSPNIGFSKTTIPTDFYFEKNMGYGTTLYPDVNYLQYILDIDPRTVVSATGAGSFDELTSYFGKKTQEALKKFQTIYGEQILVPAGLTEPNGFCGPLTRKQLNKILDLQRTDGVVNSSTSGSSGNTGATSGTGASSGTNDPSNTMSATKTTTTSNTKTKNNTTSTKTGSGATTGLIMTGVSAGASGLSSGGTGGMGMGGGMGSQNFGGTVSQTTYCTCSASIMLDIDDVRGQSVSLIYMPGVSQLFKNYNVFFGMGQYVLGTYTSGGTCLVYDGEECDTQGNPDGTILLIGTSGM